MAKAPSAEEIQQYLDVSHIQGLHGATVEPVAVRNHLIFRATKGGETLAVRMINPVSYRRGEWISMAEEYAILRAIGHTGLGPQVYFLDEQHEPPFLIQEFVQAKCFNDLKPLSEEHLVAAAQAIATLNAMDISPVHFPFMRKYVRKDYAGSGWVWYYRLADSIRCMPRRDIARWAFKIFPLVRQAMAALSRSLQLLPQDFSFHFDGAHAGNTYWRDRKVIFLDWQKVSWRNDPSFTLVRFATSVGEKGEVPEAAFKTLVRAYLDVRSIPNFDRMAWMRLLERQTADLVWVLWDAARRRDRLPVEQGTSIVPRYAAVQEMLRNAS